MGSYKTTTPIKLIVRGVHLGTVYFLEPNQSKIPPDVDGRVDFIYELLRKSPPQLKFYVRELERYKGMFELYINVFGSVKNARPLVLPRRAISATIQRALSRAKFEIPSPPTTILVFPQYQYGGDGKAAAGLSMGWNSLVVSVNPRQKWEDDLEETVCHEYIHAVREVPRPKDRTVGVLLVEEGLSLHFTKYLFSHRDKLVLGTGSYARRLLQKVRPYLHRRNETIERRLFVRGVGRGRILEGYTAGYYLIRPFLRILPNLSWNQLADISAKKILLISEYLWWGRGGRVLWVPSHRKNLRRR